MTTNPTPAPLSPEREAEIRKRIDRLNDDRVMTGSTWLASPVGPKSVFPPEQSHVVEDVLETKHSVIRGSVGVFGDKQRAEFTAHAPGDIAALLTELNRVRAERQSTNAALVELTVALRAADKRIAELHTQVEKLQGLHTCPALATNGDRCCRTPGHDGDHSSFAGRHIWSPAHAAEAARLHGCKAEYGGPGYTHCELPAGHDGQHESALGNMRRATWERRGDR
ncbi:hypothetical protein ACWY4P_40515 [Streptomyces sp. LZ34]